MYLKYLRSLIETNLLFQEKLNNHWSSEQISGRVIIDRTDKKLHLVVSTIG